MIPDPVIILAPPRSFSSVVSTMIGQHPELYGFPELHLFVAQTVGMIIDRGIRQGNYNGPHGLLRALAELHEGRQTTPAILRAALWLHERRDWSTQALFDYLLRLIAPRIGVEKSPITCMRLSYLSYVHQCYPRARYLHLTRHPVATRKSMESFFARKALKGRLYSQRLEFNHLLLWYHMHRNILTFTSRLPEGQVLRIKGEALLSDPDRYLPQIAEWLGVRTDRSAIEAMKHPERSPYARFGPPPARGGNDALFMQNPELRAGPVPEPSLAEWLQGSQRRWISVDDESLFHELGLELMPPQAIAEEVSALAHRLGYH